MYNARSRRRRRHIVPEEREKTFRSHLDSIKISTVENKSATDLPKVSILSHTHRPLILWGRSWGTRWHRCCWAWRWYWWGWPSRMWTDDLPLGLDGGQQRKHHVTSQFFLQWHKGLILKKKRLLTQVVEAPLWAESDLPFQVVRLFCPRLKDSESSADARLRYRQFVLTWGQEDAPGVQNSQTNPKINLCQRYKVTSDVGGIKGHLYNDYKNIGYKSHCSII